MKNLRREIEFAIEVFVRGHSAGKSRTFPYEVRRVGPLWVMRDAPRKNPRGYRKEEWIAHDVEPADVDAIARRQTRGRYFVCAMVAEGAPDAPTRTAYKALGYRLLATEGFLRAAVAEHSQDAVSRADRTGAHARTGGAAGKCYANAPDRKRTARRRRAVPPVRGPRRSGRCWPRTERGCHRGNVVRRHACQGIAPASRDRTGLAVPNVARRPGPRLEMLGADGLSHGRPVIPTGGIRADREAVHVCTGAARAPPATLTNPLVHVSDDRDL